VRTFFEVHGEGRFGWWHRAADDRAGTVIQRAGMKRLLNAEGRPIKSDSQHWAELGERVTPAMGEETSIEYFVLAGVFRSEVCRGFDHRAVCKVLADHGCLVSDAGR
jgi:putative DNA primase/helicase